MEYDPPVFAHLIEYAPPAASSIKHRYDSHRCATCFYLGGGGVSRGVYVRTPCRSAEAQALIAKLSAQHVQLRLAATWEQVVLDGKEASCFRALAARANYLALDKADIQYATKEICRGMALPMAGDMRKLKRLARHSITRPRVISDFVFQGRLNQIVGYSDSDWAGCWRTAKSTSGGAIMIGRHCVKTWSSTQKSGR